MTPLPGEEGYTASVALEGTEPEPGWFGGPPGFGRGSHGSPELIAVGTFLPPDPDALGEDPHVVSISVAAWRCSPQLRWAMRSRHVSPRVAPCTNMLGLVLFGGRQ